MIQKLAPPNTLSLSNMLLVVGWQERVEKTKSGVMYFSLVNAAVIKYIPCASTLVQFVLFTSPRKPNVE